MVDPVLVEQATSLSVDERLELIGAVWNSIDHATRRVSPATAELIEARVADAKANPRDGQDWEVARREFRERYEA
jgi:putative addiction module component (TIGR02574 family)